VHKCLRKYKESTLCPHAFIDPAGIAVVSVACFLVVSIPTLQAIVMTRPEILILVVGLNILIGRWKGLRLMEYLRFSKLMKG